MKNLRIVILITLVSINFGCTMNFSSSHMTGLSFAGPTSPPPINTVPLIWKAPVIMSSIQQKSPKSFKPIKLNLDSVMFQTGKAILSQKGKHKINEFATVIQHYGTQNILIEGHTDNVGKKSNNQKLSERRANTVRKSLITKGINQNRLLTKGLGEKQPFATNGTATGRQKNRRVELTILPTGQKSLY